MATPKKTSRTAKAPSKRDQAKEDRRRRFNARLSAAEAKKTQALERLGRFEDRLTAFEERIRRRFGAVVSRLVAEHGGAHRAAQHLGMPRSSLRAYIGRKGDGRTKDASVPTLGLAATIAEAAGGVSLDYLAGFDDVPRLRVERSKEGDFLGQLRKAVVERVSSDSRVSSEFAAAVLPTSSELLEEALASLSNSHTQYVVSQARKKDDQLEADRLAPPSVENGAQFILHKIIDAALAAQSEDLDRLRQLPPPTEIALERAAADAALLMGDERWSPSTEAEARSHAMWRSALRRVIQFMRERGADGT